MLEVGNGMSINEDRAHFSMWCLLAAPLISGNDLANMSPDTLGILANKAVVAVDQDPLGVEGFADATNGTVEIWFKPLANGDWAMCAFNRGTQPQNISFDWKNEQVADPLSKRDAHFDTTTYSLKNLWTQQDAGDTTQPLNTDIPGHDVLMLRLTQK
jgi:alpha-galactosidase